MLALSLDDGDALWEALGDTDSDADGLADCDVDADSDAEGLVLADTDSDADSDVDAELTNGARATIAPTL